VICSIKRMRRPAPSRNRDAGTAQEGPWMASIERSPSRVLLFALFSAVAVAGAVAIYFFYRALAA
jgi:hypothetical protein